MTQSVHLTPFFERTVPVDRVTLDDGYVAGFRDGTGQMWGALVPLDAELVEGAVWHDLEFDVLLKPDGTFLLLGEGISDEALQRASDKGSFSRATLEELVRDCIAPDQLAAEDDPVSDLAALRHQLASALQLVDKALANLKKG